MSNVYVHFSEISFPARYSVVNFRLESHSLRFREVIRCFLLYRKSCGKANFQLYGHRHFDGREMWKTYSFGRISPMKNVVFSTYKRSFKENGAVILPISWQFHCHVDKSLAVFSLPDKSKKNFLPFAQRPEILPSGRPDCLGLVDRQPF